MVRTDEALREWDAVVRELTTSEEREAFFNEVKHVSTLSDYAQAIARHVRDTNEGSKTIRIAKWIRPVLEGLNMIAPMAMNLCPVDTRISGVVLGAIANVLAVSSKYVDYQERLERKVAEMASMLDFAAQYSDYVFPKSLSLRKALIKLYSVILRFCVDASRLFIARDGSKRAAISRVVRSSWETFETRFGDVTAEFAQRYEEFKLAIGACRDRAIAQLHHNQNAATDMLQHGLSTLERKLQEDHEREEMRRIKERTASLRQERKRLLALLPSGFSREIQEEKLINIVDGTGQWLLDSQAFQCWLTQPRSQLLWVYGKHGSGKSHVASRIINELRFQCDSERAAASCSDDLTALAYVYCSSLTEGGNNPKQLLGSILHQLFAQHPPAAKLPALPQAFHGDYDLTASGGVTISDIKSAIAALSAWFSRTLLVFDGLDECSRSEREDRAGGPRNAGKENFQRLCEFLSILPKDAAPSAAIKILVFSRPDYPEIETSFAGCARIQADGGANEDDIKKYITQTTEELGMKNSRVLGEVKSKLLSGSEGMFLWARLFIGILKDECRTAKDVQDAMKELPHSLGDVYRRSLERIVRQPPRVRTRALTAIMWVVNAKRFLSKAEMLQLLAVQPDMEDWDEDCEFEREGGLLPECGDLIQLVNDRYKLIHASLKEFLTGSLAGMQSIQEYRQIQQEQAERMAETCLVFLNLGSFKRGPTQTKSELKALVHGHPFLDYAATQWGNHLAEVEDLSERGEELYNLATRLLHSDDARELCRQLALHLSSGTDSTLVFPYFGRTTPLHLLAMFNLFRLAELLPDTVEQLDHEDMFKYTPLDDAFNHKNRQMAEWLLQKHLRHRDRVEYRPRGGVKGRVYIAVENAWIVALGHLAELGEDIDRGFRGEPPLYLAATQGNVQAVNMLLSLGADINLTFEGVTPLYGAIMDGKSEAALRLIEGNADISIGAVSSNTNALHGAAWMGDLAVTNALIRRGADIHADSTTFCHTPLSYAVWNNKTEVVRLLIERGADGNVKGTGWTCLSLAATVGSKECLELLLRSGADPATLDEDGRSAVHDAASKGYLDCIDILAEQGAPLDVLSLFGRTPLHEAILAGQIEAAVALLRRYNCSPSQQGALGETALHIAAAAVKGDNASAFLLTLLDFGAELLSRTSSGNTALHISSKDGNTRFAEALMNTAEAAQLVQSQNDDGETPLHLAARDGSQAVVDLLLRHEPSLRHARDKKLRMPLHRAAEGGHLNCLECLGDQESWDSPGFQSRTPLFCASSAGHLPVVRFLLQKTQMIDAEDEEGLTTLTVALAHNHIAVANELLDHHADPTAGGRLTGFTSLLFAVQSKDEEIVRRIVGFGHDHLILRREAWEGRTPFSEAVCSGSLGSVECFLERGQDGTLVATNYGQSCVLLAAVCGHSHILRRLLDLHPEELYTVDYEGHDLLEYAAAGGSLDVLAFLIRRGLGPDGLQRGSSTPISQSVACGHLASVDLLLRCGADATHISCLPYGESLLHVSKKFLRIASRLLEAGVNPHALDVKGQTALQRADPHVREKIALYLSSPAVSDTTLVAPSELIDPGPSSPPHRVVFNAISWILEPPEQFRALRYRMPHYRSECVHFLRDVLRSSPPSPEKIGEIRLLSVELASLSGPKKPLSCEECTACQDRFTDEVRYACTQCDALLCSPCHADYASGEDSGGTGNRIKGLRALQDLETKVYALRCVADACHDQYAIFIKAIGVVMHYGEYEDFLQPLIKAYKDWDAAYNYSKQFANVCIPGQRFLNLVEETARWHDGLSENASNDGGAQISRSLDQYFAENMAEKELEYFFCRGHTYVEVPQASNLADKEQENFDADGRLTEASLRAMQRKYEQETPPFSVVRQTSGPKMEKLHFVEDEEVYRQRLVQNSRRSQRERYLYSLDFIFRSSPEVEQLMKGHSGPIFAPFTSQMEDLLLEGLCYEIAWQFSQIFLFGFVSTTLTDIMVQDDLEAERRGLAEEVTAEGEVPQDGTPIPTAQHPPSASLESRPNFLDVEDEFLGTLPEQLRGEIITFANKAKDRSGTSEQPRRLTHSTWELYRLLTPRNPSVRAYFAFNHVKDHAPFYVYDFYSNPVLPRLIHKQRQARSRALLGP